MANISLDLLTWDFLLFQNNIWTTTTWSNVWAVLPKPSWDEFLIGFLVWTPASNYLHLTTFSTIVWFYSCSYICNSPKMPKKSQIVVYISTNIAIYCSFAPRFQFNLVIWGMLFPKLAHVWEILFPWSGPYNQGIFGFLFFLIHGQVNGFLKTTQGNVMFWHVAKAIRNVWDKVKLNYRTS